MKSKGKDGNGEGTPFVNQQISEDRPSAWIPMAREREGDQGTTSFRPPGWHHKDQPLMEPVKKDGPEQRSVSGGLLLKPYALRGAMDLDR